MASQPFRLEGSRQYYIQRRAGKSLHWFPYPPHINFKLCLLTFRCLNYLVLKYISSYIKPVSVLSYRASFRSSTSGQLCLLIPPVVYAQKYSATGAFSVPTVGTPFQKTYNTVGPYTIAPPFCKVSRVIYKPPSEMFKLQIPLSWIVHDHMYGSATIIAHSGITMRQMRMEEGWRTGRKLKD